MLVVFSRFVGVLYFIQVVSVLNECYYFLGGLCFDVKRFGDIDRFQLRVLVLNI